MNTDWESFRRLTISVSAPADKSFLIRVHPCYYKLGLRRSLQAWQARGSNGLAVAFVLFIRNVECDLRRQFRELLMQHRFRPRQNQIPTRSRSDSAEDQDVLEIIKIGQVSNCVSEVHANRFVDFSRAVLALGHELLDLLEFFRQRHFRLQFNSRNGDQPSDALLREVLHAATSVPRPFIDRSLWVVV